MVNCPEGKLEALITIADYEYGKDIEKLLKKSHIPFFLFANGQGSAKAEIFEILGYGGPKKIVLISLQAEDMSRHLIREMSKDINFEKPGTGIGCTISISSINSALSKICQSVHENNTMESEDLSIMAKEPYHLIITIVNSGEFEEVMEAAREAGATGGTLIHARGLGAEEATKYLGITIQPEKDLVLILAKKEMRQEIMQNITKKVGLNSEGKGICFSLPVNSVFGAETQI